MVATAPKINLTVVDAQIDAYLHRLKTFVKAGERGTVHARDKDFEDNLKQFLEGAVGVPGLTSKLEALKLAPGAAREISPAVCVEFVRSLRDATKAMRGKPDQHLDQLHALFAGSCNWFGQLYAQEVSRPSEADFGGREAVVTSVNDSQVCD